MDLSNATSKTLVTTLARSLAQPTARSGRKLRTEEELAEQLGLGRWRLREALNDLVRQGILSRRRGAGSYLRRVPAREETTETDGFVIPTRVLFADEDERGQSRSPVGSAHRFHIGLWGDLHNQGRNQPNQRILALLSERLGDMGHSLTMHPTTNKDGALSADRLRELVRQQPCDVYLVVGRYMNLFREAVGKTDRPIVSFSISSRAVDFEPMVMLETERAIERAIGIFHRQGYERIAAMFLGEREGLVSHRYPLFYEAITGALGLTYKNTIVAQPAGIPGIREMQAMLKESDRPDALYVGDDHLIPGVAEAMSQAGVEPGRDLAVITLSNSGMPLGGEVRWSRLEFDLEVFVEQIVSELMGSLGASEPRRVTVAHHPVWKPGQTHGPDAAARIKDTAATGEFR